jgi:hypothetical protein
VLVEYEATPALTATVCKMLEPSKNCTEPAAVVGFTVAVSLTLEP